MKGKVFVGEALYAVFVKFLHSNADVSSIEEEPLVADSDDFESDSKPSSKKGKGVLSPSSILLINVDLVVDTKKEKVKTPSKKTPKKSSAKKSNKVMIYLVGHISD